MRTAIDDVCPRPSAHFEVGASSDDHRSDEDKVALVNDAATPFFTTPHFDGHTSVLVRASRLGQLDRDELAEIIAEAWLARAPKRLAASWLEDHPNWPCGG